MRIALVQAMRSAATTAAARVRRLGRATASAQLGQGSRYGRLPARIADADISGSTLDANIVARASLVARACRLQMSEIENLIARLRTHALCIQPDFCARAREQAALEIEQIQAGCFQLSCGCAWFDNRKVIFCPQHPDLPR